MYFAGIVHYMDNNGRESSIFIVCTNCQELASYLSFWSDRYGGIRVTNVRCDTFLTLSEANDFISAALSD